MKIDYEKRIFGLDIMRAVAILLVVASHAVWIFPPAKNVLTDLMSIAGVLGVEIFFVLSGFLIGRLIYRLFVNDDFNFKSVSYFWVRRWFRTLPNYYLILLFNLVLALFLGTVLPDHVWQYAFFIQNFAWEMPLFFGESWSLPIEEFAYIIGPLLLYLVLFFKLKINRSRLFFYVTCVILLFFFITKVFYNTSHPNTNMIFWNVNLKAVTIYRIDAIYYGVLAAYLSIIRVSFWKRYRYLFLILGGLMFLGLNFVVPMKQIFIESHPFFWNVLYLPINSVAIACTLPFLSQLKSAPKWILIPVTLISLISYSMYLIHYSVVMQLMKHFFPTEALSTSTLTIYLTIYIVVTIMLSYILYILFERPMTNLRDSDRIKNHFK
ncbi:acyltransferase family protein [Psychroserpens algicola]|uniref:Acyltransferase n=1 Tax=Psychroserpens algicola TaxID=1719034 RepID=A0ABT0HCQ4_9FLAO|nr:acyltransferase [Psychroserpens algicola]MCK8482151.1 acyltransferase [Psychroserpens algicola]